MKLMLSVIGLLLPVILSQAATCPSSVNQSKPTLLSFDYQPGQILSELQTRKVALFEGIEQIESIPREDRTFSNTVVETDRLFSQFLQMVSRITASSSSHRDKFVREESEEFSQNVQEIFSEVSTKEKLFSAIGSIKTQIPAEQFLIKTLLENSGRDVDDKLSPEKFQSFLEFNKLAGKKLSAFGQATQQDVTATLTFSKQDLAGLNQEALHNLEKTADGSYLVSLDQASVVDQILTLATLEATRKAVYIGFRSRSPGNYALLKEGLYYSNQAARVKGYDSDANIVINSRTLGGSPAAVSLLLSKLSKKYHESTKPLLQEMERSKSQHNGASSLLEMWDLLFYSRKVAENRSIKASSFPQIHYPVAETIEKILNFVGKLYSIDIIKSKDVKGWADHISHYTVYDKESGAITGQLYLDIYAREGKTANSYLMGISNGSSSYSKDKSEPISVIASNFGEINSISTLSEAQITILLHELGHYIHFISSDRTYFTTYGFNVSADLAEVPSTFVEIMASDASVLQQISSAHPQTKKPLSIEVLKKYLDDKKALVKNAYVKPAPFQSRTYIHNLIFVSSFDLLLNKLLAGPNAENIDIQAVYREEHIQFYGIAPPPQDEFLSTFMHPAYGYNASMYSYLWAKIAAVNLHERIVELGGISAAIDSGFTLKFKSEFLGAPLHSNFSTKLKDLIGHKLDENPILEELGLKGR